MRHCLISLALYGCNWYSPISGEKNMCRKLSCYSNCSCIVNLHKTRIRHRIWNALMVNFVPYFFWHPVCLDIRLRKITILGSKQCKKLMKIDRFSKIQKECVIVPKKLFQSLSCLLIQLPIIRFGIRWNRLGHRQRCLSCWKTTGRCFQVSSSGL